MSEQNFRVVIIGAGMAGVLAAIKLQQAGYDNVAIYEKADRVGGTWRENTYPGLTCDVPSHHYTYSFERNPDWTRHLPPGAEIQAYFERTTNKYAIDKLIEFNAEVVRAEFVAGLWQLELEDGRRDSANVVVAATGVLHQINQPRVAGLERFQGTHFHTARWDHSVALEGQRVAVIGMGSTGVQIISDLSARGIDVSHFVRNPQWIMPVENGHYSEEERQAFRSDPKVLEEAMDFEGYTASVEIYTQALIDPDSEGAKIMGQACLDNLNNSVKDPKLREQLTPDHAPMCKRLIFSPDYYQAIQRSNAHLVRSDIECIEEKGIRTRDGVLHECDVIAFATGFRADQFMRPMKVVGVEGVDLASLWAKRPSAYLSVTMPYMPNFFMLNGPNGPVGNFSLIDIAELQWGYIAQLIDVVREGTDVDTRLALYPSKQATDEFDAMRVEAAKKTIWYTGGCQSWYLDAEGVPASWPWNYSRFVEVMKAPNLDNYVLLEGVVVETYQDGIAPAFRKMLRVKIVNKRWVLRLFSVMISATRIFYRPSDSIVTTIHRLQGRDKNTIKVIEIAPKTLSREAPAIVYYHGGGFFMSYGRLHLKQVEGYAEQLQVRVFFVEYRLSTEQTFPGPLNDCISALDWVYANADRLKVQRERIAVMGDSAGGCLAAAVAQQVHDENKQRDQPQVIRAQLLIYPALDCDSKTHSAQSFKDTPVWNASNNKIMWQVYLGRADELSPLAPPAYASPIHRDDFSGLPPAYIESAEFDPLRDEAQDYADALTAAGVEVRHAMIAGAVHGYDYVDCEITQQAKANRLASMQALLCD